MQIYIDANDIQQLLVEGTISIDADSDLPCLTVIWDTTVDGEIPNLNEVGGYSRVDNALVYSQAEFDANELAKAQLIIAEQASLLAAYQAQAASLIDEHTIHGIVQRAFAKIVMDELNLLRKWTRDFKTEVAAATNLADLKIRVGTLPTFADRNLGMLKTEIQTLINSGDVS